MQKPTVTFCPRDRSFVDGSVIAVLGGFVEPG